MKTQSANRELYIRSLSEVYVSPLSADAGEKVRLLIIFDPRGWINSPRLMHQR